MVPATRARADEARDLLATCAPPATTVLFGGPDIPPIPGDFFAPGSLPFEGTVYFTGLSLDASSTTDTILRRPAGDPFAPGDPPGGPVTVPVELMDMRLVSVEPIIVNPGGQAWDVELTLPPTPPPVGQLRATKTHANGGTFSADLPVQPRFTFTRVDAPFTRIELDVPPGAIILEFPSVPWVSDVDPWLPLPGPSVTNFHPGIQEVIPGDPSSQLVVPSTGVDPGSMQHTLCPAQISSSVPSLPRFGLGAAALGLLIVTMLTIRHRAAVR